MTWLSYSLLAKSCKNIAIVGVGRNQWTAPAHGVIANVPFWIIRVSRLWAWKIWLKLWQSRFLGLCEFQIPFLNKESWFVWSVWESFGLNASTALCVLWAKFRSQKPTLGHNFILYQKKQAKQGLSFNGLYILYGISSENFSCFRDTYRYVGAEVPKLFFACRRSLSTFYWFWWNPKKVKIRLRFVRRDSNLSQKWQQTPKLNPKKI